MLKKELALLLLLWGHLNTDGLLLGWFHLCSGVHGQAGAKQKDTSWLGPNAFWIPLPPMSACPGCPPASGLFSQASEKNETLWNLILVPHGGATCTNGCSLLSSNSIRTKTLRWHKDPKRVANLSRLACQFKKSTPKSYFRILKLPRLLGMSPTMSSLPRKAVQKAQANPQSQKAL